MNKNQTKKVPSLRRQKSPYLFIVISLIIIIILIAGFWLIKQKTQYIAYKNIKIGNEIFKLEVADTQATREKGLSGRDHLNTNDGMLFDFKQNGDWRMWMLSMRFNIDIAWLTKEGKIVHIKSDATPGSYPEAYHANAQNWYVIEVPAGTFERLAIKEGQTISIN